MTAYLRFHQGTVLTQAATLSNFIIYADGFTDEDPGALDPSTLPAFQTALSTTDIKAITTYGTMKVIAVPANFGSMLSIGLQYTAAATGTKYVISVDLVCKEF